MFRPGLPPMAGGDNLIGLVLPYGGEIKRLDLAALLSIWRVKNILIEWGISLWRGITS